MKVVDEIISYLFYENVITEEALEVLKAKGYYSKEEAYLSEWEYWELKELEMDRLFEQNIKDEEILSLEKALADNRRRKQGKKARFKGAKKRHRQNRKSINLVNNYLHKKMTYSAYDGFTFTEDVFDKVRQLPIREVNNLYGLLHKYYEKCFMFWNDLARMIGEEEVIKYNDQLIKIFSAFNTLQEGNKSQSVKQFIQPVNFFKLKKEVFIQNTGGWELVLKIDEKEILITNFEGKFEK